MKIAILGFGREGQAVFKYLKSNKAYKNARISILDQKNSSGYLKNLKSFNVIFRSPGVPYNLPEIQAAKIAGVKITSATKLFFDSVGGQNHVIGITGTKGKGTTSTLLYNMFKAAKRPVALAGNIGKPAIDILPRLVPGTTVILELSSFQLQDLETSPQTAAVLDIFPDHLDSHKNFAEYVSAKSSIAMHQKKRGRVFYAAGNPHAKYIAELSQGKITEVNENNWRLFSREDLKIPGEHNFKNAVMAAAIALAHGLPEKAIIRAVKNFHGLPHRLELVKKLPVNIPLIRANEGYNDGKINSVVRGDINFYNDSASTNPQTSAAAARAFKEPLILIAGGKDKNLNYSPLARAVQESKNLKAIILFGENKSKIATALKQTNKKLIVEKNLTSATYAAYREAKKVIPLEAISYKLEAVILFSPGAASFDMFKDYADRGEKFKEIVKNLK
jgi:UDP-N-acetylmuramoylalanine--D-glutamate ligase